MSIVGCEIPERIFRSLAPCLDFWLTIPEHCRFFAQIPDSFLCVLVDWSDFAQMLYIEWKNSGIPALLALKACLVWIVKCPECQRDFCEHEAVLLARQSVILYCKLCWKVFYYRNAAESLWRLGRQVTWGPCWSMDFWSWSEFLPNAMIGSSIFFRADFRQRNGCKTIISGDNFFFPAPDPGLKVLN